MTGAGTTFTYAIYDLWQRAYDIPILDFVEGTESFGFHSATGSDLGIFRQGNVSRHDKPSFLIIVWPPVPMLTLSLQKLEGFRVRCQG